MLDQQIVGKTAKCVILFNIRNTIGDFENLVVFRQFFLGLILIVNQSTSTERLRAPCNGYLMCKGCASHVTINI